MKAILKFNLPEESHEFANAVDKAKMRGILWDVKEYFRDQMKYQELNEIQYKTLQDFSEYFWNLINAENIDLDK